MLKWNGVDITEGIFGNKSGSKIIAIFRYKTEHDHIYRSIMFRRLKHLYLFAANILRHIYVLIHIGSDFM